MNQITPANSLEEHETVTFCYRHPDTETGLRCNRCGNPICAKCAVRTDVGFRCPDCVRQQQDKFYTGGRLDYVIAVVIALPLSLIAAAVFTFIIVRTNILAGIQARHNRIGCHEIITDLSSTLLPTPLELPNSIEQLRSYGTPIPHESIRCHISAHHELFGQWVQNNCHELKTEMRTFKKIIYDTG